MTRSVLSRKNMVIVKTIHWNKSIEDYMEWSECNDFYCFYKYKKGIQTTAFRGKGKTWKVQHIDLKEV